MKSSSFTLSELIISMIIAVIVISMGFSALGFVNKTVTGINKDYERQIGLSYFEQRIWKDFNSHSKITVDRRLGKIAFYADTDTTLYTFTNGLILRNHDSIEAHFDILETYYRGEPNGFGSIDAASLKATGVNPEYKIFVFQKPDAAGTVNDYGFSDK